MTSEEAPPNDASTDLDSAFNPYHMGSNQSGSFTLVSQPLIGAENFNSWKKAVRIALSGKNKEGFLTGDIEKPKDPKLAIAWKCNNDTIASWIINSVSKNIAASIVYTRSVKEIWDELIETYKESNGPRIYQLRKELITTTQGSSSVTEYYTKMKTIWQDLCEFRPDDCKCEAKKSLQDYLQSEFTMIFLMGLSDSFGAVRTQILLMEPIPSINKVFSLIVQDERQRVVGDCLSPIDPIALAVSEQPKKESGTSYRKRPYYTHSNRIGHTIEKFFKIHGYPPGYKTKNSTPLPTESASSNAVSQANPASILSSLSVSQCTQLDGVIKLSDSFCKV